MAAGELREVLRRPVVVAPMGGGPTTPALVGATAGAGALAFLAGSYKTGQGLRDDMAAVRAATSEAFGVNLFVPGAPTSHREEMAAYIASLAGEAESAGAELGDPRWDDDHWEEKIGALVDDPPAVASFTFGCPEREVIEAFHDRGCLVAVTVTDLGEARLAESRGADCLCVQGVEAGGHRGSFRNDGGGEGLGVLELVGEVSRATALPQIAAGGIMDSEGVMAVLRAGAVAAQCGTAFLCCPESGASAAHKAAILEGSFAGTALTRSFSGRPARGLVNRFMSNHPGAPAAYPEINNATRPLRAAAARRGDAGRMSLWAGTGFRRATGLPAGEVVERLDPGRSASS